MPRIKLIISGFTLIEITIVLFIVTLLLGGLLMPLATQLEQRDRQQAMEQLEEIKQALLGYAIINNALPCPSSEINPIASGYGEPGAVCNEEGILPWKVLGVSEIDPWGTVRSNADDLWIGYWRYRVDSNFATSFNLNTTPDEDLSVITVNLAPPPDTITLTSSGNNTPVFIVYSTGPNREPDGENSIQNNIFQGGPNLENIDDITVWMTRPILLNIMLSAKKLP